MTSKEERAKVAKRRKAAAASRKRWMERILARERERVANWIEWYWYNRTYAFMPDHSLPPNEWPARDVEKMMKDLIGAIRRGEALSKNVPVDGWAQGERFAVAFDPESGQGYRVDVHKVDRWVCGADITLRDDEHRQLVCQLDKGHTGPHRDGAAEWTGS